MYRSSSKTILKNLLRTIPNFVKNVKIFSFVTICIKFHLSGCNYNFPGDEGSPVLVQKESGEVVCLAALSVHHNGKCNTPQGKLLTTKMSYFQDGVFDVSRKYDQNQRDHFHKLVGSFLYSVHVTKPTLGGG